MKHIQDKFRAQLIHFQYILLIQGDSEELRDLIQNSIELYRSFRLVHIRQIPIITTQRG